MYLLNPFRFLNLPVTSPGDIPNLVLWCDVGTPAEVTLSGSDITAINDQIGLSHDLITDTLTSTTNPELLTAQEIDWADYTRANSDSLKVSGATSSSVNFADGEFTIVVIMRATDDNQGTLIQKGATGSGGYYFIDINNTTADAQSVGRIRAGAHDGTNDIEIDETGENIIDGRAHVIVFQRDNVANENRLYVDNFETAASGVSNATLGDIDDGTEELHAGANIDGVGGAKNLYEGQIGEVLMYARALNADELSALFAYFSNRWNKITTPESIAGLDFWIDPSDAASVSFSGGSTISQINDKASGNHLTVGSGKGAPEIVTEGGIDWMDFISANEDTLVHTDDTAAELNFGTGPQSIFSVWKTTDATLGQTVLNKGSNQVSGGRYKINISQSTAGTYRYFIHDGAFSSSADGNALHDCHDGAPKVHAGLWDQTADFSRSRANGVQVAQTTSGSIGDIDETGESNFLSLFLVGASPLTTSTVAHFNGEIGEIAMFDTELTTNEIELMERYLHSKWQQEQDPLEIGSVEGWWDLSDSDTITIVSGVISQLDDKSGNGRDLSQATVSRRPSLVNVRGKQMGSFDAASDHFLDSGDTTNFLPGTGDVTIWGVFRRTAISSDDGPILSAGDAGDRWVIMQNQAAVGRMQANLADAPTTSPVFDDASFNHDDGKIRSMMAVREGDTWTLYTGEYHTRGVQQLDQNTGVSAFNVVPTTSLKLGAFDDFGEAFFDSYLGEIGECGYHSKAFTPTERAELFAYIFRKWGI